ncbi:Transcriptional regulator GlxA family, contains an amidase domain and an AraC-type DNA-binding HTH domain [Sinosporangium album]|uniref:Transcriptional regulator GlxA family, contains an amidase domain and an AraC-type DNA-binding HTH domain n=1 Tax=Sinosporangium album TaxID=504805 RepID=A0A1G8DGH9_9ACTN|nr:DJ-1/PfpI family protein [Sinosporangium album]SDH56818.1 Transcriptional regulator GlxA family, contains an amidase domain and an AraC-type DNA-binding HTH domain [Sinosporangium album]
MKEVVVALCDGVVLLDVAGPMQVLHGSGGYRIRRASIDGRPVRTDVGVLLGADLALDELEGPIDTLLVPGCAPPYGDRPGEAFSNLVRDIGGRARRVVSVCTGALLLAEAGLLDGRRATTHWAAGAELESRFPRVALEPDAIFVRDGPVMTSAGVTAGIDLALALVEDDHGPDLARTVAKYMVVFLQRPGGQSQFSVRGAVPATRHPGLRRLLDAIAAEPAADHTLAAMAAQVAVSERHLTRLFRREVGLTPGRYVERIRVEAAQALLETTTDGVASIARRCGLGSDETMRRTFLKVLRTTPTAYRRSFRTSRSHRGVVDTVGGAQGDAVPEQPEGLTLTC